MGIDVKHIKQAASVESRTKESIWNKEISLLGTGFGDKQKEQFYTEVSTLVEAGMQLFDSLKLIAAETTKKKEKEVLGKLINGIENGKSFHEVLAENKEFTLYESQSIKIGEESGQLKSVLTELQRFYSEKMAQRKKLISALSYPIMLFLSAIGATWFLLQFVVPMFEDMFEQFGGELPPITQLVVGLSEFINQSGLAVLISILIVGATLYYFRKTSLLRSWQARLLLGMPIFGKIAYQSSLGRFCSSMSLLLSSQVGLIQSLKLSQDMVGLYPLEKAIQRMKQKVEQGQLLNNSMRQEKIFESKLVALVKVGEEVKKLDDMFAKSADRYKKELDYRIAILSSTLEPILLLFMGVIVLLILVAMYIPIFQLSTEISF